MRPNEFSPERMKALREKKGISQEVLADKVGVNQSNIARFEKGFRKPSADVLGRIADELDCTTDYLLCRAI